MPLDNRITDLVDEIEHRIGSEQRGLPEELGKKYWITKVIQKETLRTFSRFFPNRMRYELNENNRKGNYWLIDEDICSSVEIIGAGDIDWRSWSRNYPGLNYQGVNNFDLSTAGYDFETVCDVQMLADHLSSFSLGIYVTYEAPNRIYLNASINVAFMPSFQKVPIFLYVTHAKNLSTIRPSMLNTFTDLAEADVCNYILNKIDMYNNMETAFNTIDLKLDTIAEKARRRDEIIEQLKNDHVNASNQYMPVMLTVN